MAKIINDSLLPSAPNAPLDARTEVNLLADVAKIENPSESLIFKVKETGKYYKVVSLKELSIEGTTHKKKVINEYEPFSDLQDAPKDGYKYVRMNGVWVRYQSELDPELPILVVNIKSNQGADSNIDSLKYVVKAGEKEVEMSSGEALNIPIGSNITIEFPEVEDYRKPDDIIVENVTDNLTYEVEYATEKVTVYVSADDNSSVEGQIVTSSKLIDAILPNGIYIEDKEGNAWDVDKWDGSKTANTILVLQEDISVRLEPFIGKSSKGRTFSTTPNYDNIYEDVFKAVEDMMGEENTNSNSSIKGDAKFVDGTQGYILSLGQMVVLMKYKDLIEEAITLIGGTLFSNMEYTSTILYYGSSARYATTSYNCIENSVNTSYSATTSHPVVDYERSSRRKYYKIEEHVVHGNNINFDAPYEVECKVSINVKEGNYITSNPVSFTASEISRELSLGYTHYIYDTIYINNYIADSDAIVSGEMNGPAVQAIWDEGKRHLGKYVTKEDGTKEMVLIKVDENDSRYFEDGTPIDVEGLGGKAFYFSKVAAMSYKITQMSDNLFKIQICYKYQPDETWKFFEEKWVPVFLNVLSESKTRPYYGAVGDSSGVSNLSGDFQDMNLWDYSNIMLLLFAKYGVNGYKSGQVESDRAILFNGDTLKYGNKDLYRHAIYSHTDNNTEYKADNYFLNILGLENIFYDVRAFNTNKYELIDHGIVFPTGNVTVSNDNKDNYSVKLTIMQPDGVSKELTISYDDRYYININKRLIGDYFCLIPTAVGKPNGVYYDARYGYDKHLNEVTDTIDFGKLAAMTGWIFGSTRWSSYSHSRTKYLGIYRVETDREKFEELTNTWT